MTALYVIFVPFMVWSITGGRPRPIVLAASVMSIAGAWLLTEQGAGSGMDQRRRSGSDRRYCLGGWDKPRSDLSQPRRPAIFSWLSCNMASPLSLASQGGSASNRFSLAGALTALPAILYAGLFSGGIAYTLQIFAQRYTPPAEAALIMSLESVFAAVAGATLLSERLTGPAVFGCVMILLGVVLVEAGPPRCAISACEIIFVSWLFPRALCRSAGRLGAVRQSI